MILDYSKYIKSKGEEGIVNFHTVNNTLERLNEKRGFCPFCKSKIDNGASIIGDANACVFVTTADHFSIHAKNAAQKVVEKKILDSFELIDYHRFVDILKLQKKSYPKEWEQLLRLKDK